MDRQQFISYIHEPTLLDKASLKEIEQLAKEFPYCQSLNILYLLNLRMTNLVLYENQLKSTAAHIADRKKLKELIRRTKIEERGTRNEEEVDSLRLTVDLSPESETSKQKPITSDQEQVSSHQESKTYEGPIVPIIEEDEEIRLLALKQIVEDRLKEISDRKLGVFEGEPEEDALSKEELIDKFIREEPSISRPKADFFNPVKVAKSSLEEKDGLVSETLARIHIQQGNIAKAIEIYRKLSLNFPEKSSYFAAQIKNISTEN